jgi:hypothetical protein
MAPQKTPSHVAPENRGRAETTGQAPREERQGRPSEHNSEQNRSRTEHSQSGPENRGRGETTGQAPHEERQGRPSERNSERDREHSQSGPARSEQRDGIGGGSERDRTTGQTRREDRERLQQNKGDRENERTGRGEGSHETTGQGAAGARVQITPETRTRIREVIDRERRAPRVENPNFEVSIGTRVPRTVRFVAVPQTVVEIEPAWRGFEYFLIGDRMVIIDPRTMEIVAIVDA